jgi:hypothetical protein
MGSLFSTDNYKYDKDQVNRKFILNMHIKIMNTKDIRNLDLTLHDQQEKFYHLTEVGYLESQLD